MSALNSFVVDQVFALTPNSPFEGKEHGRGVELFITRADARRAQKFYSYPSTIEEIPVRRTESER